jgi:hypothetical protein
MTTKATTPPAPRKLADYPHYLTARTRLNELLAQHEALRSATQAAESRVGELLRTIGNDGDSDVDRQADALTTEPVGSDGAIRTVAQAREDYAEKKQQLAVLEKAVKRQTAITDRIQNEAGAEISRARRPEYALLARRQAEVAIELYRVIRAAQMLRQEVLLEGGGITPTEMQGPGNPSDSNGSTLWYYLRECEEKGYLHISDVLLLREKAKQPYVLPGA